MAIYATSQSLPGGKTKGPGASTQEVVLTAIVAVTTAMIDNANDEVGLFWVPKGFIPTSIVFNTTDMDGSTGLLWDVGSDGDESFFAMQFVDGAPLHEVAVEIGVLVHEGCGAGRSAGSNATAL